MFVCKNCMAKLAARCAKVFSFLNSPLGALPLHLPGGSAQTPVIPHWHISEPALKQFFVINYGLFKYSKEYFLIQYPSHVIVWFCNCFIVFRYHDARYRCMFLSANSAFIYVVFQCCMCICYVLTNASYLLLSFKNFRRFLNFNAKKG